MKASNYHSRLAIGHERYLDFVQHDGNIIGAIEIHPSAKDGSQCQGGIFFDVSELPDTYLRGDGSRVTTWAVESWEPLTISPSVLCGICGNHGFIRDGKWVIA